MGPDSSQVLSLTSLFDSAPGSPVFFLVLSHAKLIPTSGTWYLLFLPSGPFYLSDLFQMSIASLHPDFCPEALSTLCS